MPRAPRTAPAAPAESPAPGASRSASAAGPAPRATATAPPLSAAPNPATGGRSSAPGSLAPYDLDEAVAHLCRRDRSLARVVDAVGECGLRIRPTGSTVAALAESIVYQQLTGKAAATIHARVCALFPRPAAGPTASGLLALSDEALRGAGLSAAKVAALKDLAARARARQVPTLKAMATMDDEAIVEQLTAVRGIGRWTVEMLLVFRLGRPDVLAVDDYGLRKGLGAVRAGGAPDIGDLPGRDALRAAGERWRPYRSVASWYLWRAAERPDTAAPTRRRARPIRTNN